MQWRLFSYSFFVFGKEDIWFGNEGGNFTALVKDTITTFGKEKA
ncbi:hypothetical protein [uncultured Mucilaginibacter sp.]|nr:hypothetical protein [uncultured Mucilaginibacter sp.]